MARRLLRERVSLRGIARATGLSRSWLQQFVNTLYPDDTPHDPGPLKKTGELILEADELWSFVGTKREQWWVWVALDAGTRQVVAMVAGDRNEATARCLWDALPDEYQDGAIVCTDFLAVYRAVVPEERHAAAGKEARLTNHVERFWWPSASGGPGSSARPSPFPSAAGIMWARCGTSSATTTLPCCRVTTPFRELSINVTILPRQSTFQPLSPPSCDTSLTSSYTK